MEDYGDVFGDPDNRPPGPGAVDLTGPTPSMSPQPDYNGMMAPLPPEVDLAHRPAATPAELGKRKSQWQELFQKFQSSPNLQRAMMMMGLNMMQPVAPGQTTQGAFAQSAVVGLNAYQIGQQEELRQAAGMRQEGRAERSLAIQEEDLGTRKAAEARTAAREPLAVRQLTAGVKSAEVGAERDERTLEDVIKSAALNRENAEILLDEKKKDVALTALERDNKALLAYAQRDDIAPGVKRRAELEAAKIDETRAQAAKHRQDSKTGSQRTAVDATKEFLGEMYDALPPDDANKRGRTRPQYIMENVNKEKPIDRIKPYGDWIKAKLDAGEKVTPAEWDLYNKAIASMSESRGPRPGTDGSPEIPKFTRDPKTGKLVPPAQPGIAKPAAKPTATAPRAEPPGSQIVKSPAPAPERNAHELKTMIIGPLTSFDDIKAAAAAGNPKAIARLKEIEEAEANRAPNQPGT